MNEFIECNIHNLLPLRFNKKEEVLSDLDNLEQSWTGRIDVMFVNSFFMESIQLVINAIALLEEGYFDCSFYSLRQSLEISTTAVYFADNEENLREKKIKEWLEQKDFPMNSQMIKHLVNYGEIFSDMQKNMAPYFEDIKIVKRSIDKYVHKQGYDKFYVLINRYNDNKEMIKEKIVSDFDLFLKKSIGMIAILRLSIDPFPILLKDEEIYSRTPELLTAPFSDEFVNKYIGKENIEAYKNTNLYKEYYYSIIKKEKMLPSVIELVKYQFVKRQNINEILKQKHLLSQDELVAVMIFNYSKKIANVYCPGGLLWYHSDIHTKRKLNSLNSQDFSKEKFKINQYNIPYDEAFLSYIEINGKDYYIEHNEILNEEEIAYLKELKFRF